jgi:5'-deoxynucleotidase YfbR-like HD superfamily hydrolase
VRVTVSNEWISTYTNQRVFPFDPDKSVIKIEDIAHSLAMICRWGGHALTFYSVAEHSVRVADLLYVQAVKAGKSLEESRKIGFLGLMHDATEAYVGDIPRPIKGSMFLKTPRGMEGFRETEAHVYRIIEEALNLPPYSKEEEKLVHEADNIILVTEARDVQHGFAKWDYWLDHPEPLEGTIFPMTWEVAKATFLERWEMYGHMNE